MHEHADNAPPPDASAGHERSDANIGPLLIAVGALIAVTIVVHFVLIGVMWIFEQRQERTDPPVSPVASVQIPPAPMLQPTMDYHDTWPAQDMQALQEHDKQILGSYGWVDRDKSIVRIPINVAMQKLLEQSQSSAPTTQEVVR